MSDLNRRLAARLRTLSFDDRGDVPGWVFVTIMTAGLVTTLWLVAEDQLREIFSSALSRVTR
jgi:hypothetical protein